MSNAIFEAAPEGFRSQNAGRPPAHLVRELVQNPFDEAATRVTVDVEPHPKGGVSVRVTDDVPGGIADERHAFTIWLSGKTDSPTKRGRMGRGMKELISVADRTAIASEGWGLIFARDEQGEWSRRKGPKSRCGTTVTAQVRLWAPECIPDVLAFLRRIQPPEGIQLVVNGEAVVRRPARESYPVSLPTIMYEVANGERVSRERIRRTNLDLFAEADGASWVYEMGLPIEPIDYPLSIDVGQRVPLREQRDTLTAPYRARLFATLMNLRHEQMALEAFKEKHAIDAAHASEHLTPEAKAKIAEAWTEGRPFAASPLMMSQATGQHIQVTNLRSLPEPIRGVVREAGKDVTEVLEQRRIASCSVVPERGQTDSERRTVRLFQWLAAGIDRPCKVRISIGNAGHRADFQRVGAVLTIYRHVVGAAFFDKPTSAEALGLLAHELAHWQQHGDEHGGSFHSDGEYVGGAIAAYLYENVAMARRLLARSRARLRAVAATMAAAEGKVPS